MKKYTVKIKTMTNPPFTKLKVIKIDDLEELNDIKGLQDFKIIEKN